jgi:hypothetical protein
MPDNTVQATLRSNYEDGIGKGVEQTQALMERAFSSIKNGSEAVGEGFASAFESVSGTLEGFRTKLSKAADESENSFKKMSFGAAAFGIAVTEMAIIAARALGSFVLDRVKQASAAFDAKIAFEDLTSAAGVQADVFSGQLKRATEGQVSGLVLLRNANKIMQSDIPVSTDMYAKLTENVFRLAKSAGVDTAQAMDILTNSLIRGNARGFQAIGIHINVKDAISQMQEATTGAANATGDASKLQAFYNSLLEKTDEQVSRLATKHLTLEDILVQAENTYNAFLGTLGVAILRSGVFQEILERASESMLGMSLSTAKQDAVTLQINSSLINLIERLATVIQLVGFLSVVWDAVWGTLKAGFLILAEIVNGIISMVAAIAAGLLAPLQLLPGKAGEAVRGIEAVLLPFIRKTISVAGEMGQSITHSFDGFGSGRTALNGMADGARKLAEDLAKLSGTVVHGAAGFGEHTEAANKNADAVSKLAQELKKYQDLLGQLNQRSGNPELTALEKLRKNLQQINELTLLSDKQRNTLREAALREMYDTMAQIRQKAANQEQAETDRLGAELKKSMDKVFKDLVNRDELGIATDALGRWAADTVDKILVESEKKQEQEQHRQIAQAVSTASAIQQAVAAANAGKVAPSIKIAALDQLPQTIATLKAQLKTLESQPIFSEQQISEVIRMKEAIDKLNQIKFTPFQKAIQTMKDGIGQFVQQGAQAFAGFFSDIVSGQEGAGKKLLAAFIGMVGQLIVQMGTTLVSAGITELMLAATVMGRLAGANEASGYAAIAQGAALLAVGGALGGLASVLTSSSTASASSGSSTVSGSSGSSNPTQMINVGSPYGNQNGASNQSLQTLEIKLQPIPGYATQQMQKEYRLNGPVRVLVNG